MTTTLIRDHYEALMAPFRFYGPDEDRSRAYKYWKYISPDGSVIYIDERLQAGAHKWEYYPQGKAGSAKRWGTSIESFGRALNMNPPKFWID